MIRNILIIGSGAAGLTAAIYAARANLKPLVIEGVQAGGQLTITTEVENFPGFPEGIMGPELMDRMRRQAERFGTEMVRGEVSSVDLSKRPFTVTVEGEQYRTQTLIIATGASARLLGIESEKRFMGRGVSACATCDGFFYRNKEVMVVGGGDTAVEESTFLATLASKVTLIHRRDQLRASKIMQEKASKNPKISFLWDSEVSDILGDDVVTGIRLKNVKTGQLSDHGTDGVFIAIGHQPNTKLFEGSLELDRTGYIITHGGTKTKVPGVFACGDVQDSRYRQAISAAGSGCMAALDAQGFLEGLG